MLVASRLFLGIRPRKIIFIPALGRATGMPNRTSTSGSELFIVDNRDTDWKVTLAASKGSKGEGGFVDVWKRGCFAWEYKRKLRSEPVLV